MSSVGHPSLSLRCALSLLSEAGVSRSATMVISYVMRHRGLGAAAAYKLVKEGRPIVHPNPGFMGQLIEYQQKLVAEGIVPAEGVEDGFFASEIGVQLVCLS